MTASQAVNQRTATVDELKRLRDRYLDLTNRALPQLALAASIPDPIQSLASNGLSWTTYLGAAGTRF